MRTLKVQDNYTAIGLIVVVYQHFNVLAQYDEFLFIDYSARSKYNVPCLRSFKHHMIQM